VAFHLFSVGPDCRKESAENQANFLWPPPNIAYFRRPPYATENTLISAFFYSL
jgi:hypothetical protein